MKQVKKGVMSKFGITLLELIIVLGILAVTSTIVYNIYYKTATTFLSMQESSAFSQDSMNFFYYLIPLMQNNCQILTTGNYDFTFVSSGNIYQLKVAGYPDSPPPYTIMMSKNGGTFRPLIRRIARLSSPDRPGMELFFWDRTQEPARTTADIVVLQAALTFQGLNINHPFRSAIFVGSGTEAQ
jgi:prepilin-type N-terminal cleavage/methylation domain-containing protein